MPMDLLTEHAIYKNMVLIGLHPVHQAPYKGALILDLRFHQVGINGDTGLVSKSGGRPKGILAQDGTQATASGYINAGEVYPVSGGSLQNKCTQDLSGLGRR